MDNLHITYILSQRGEKNFESGVEDLPHEDETREEVDAFVIDIGKPHPEPLKALKKTKIVINPWEKAFQIAMVTTCWGYLCYFRDGEEDLFKSDWALYFQGRYYRPAQLLQHAAEYVEVWVELLREGESELMFLDEDEHLYFKLSGDGTVSISYRTSSMFIRSYSGISLENLRGEFYRFGKSLLEGYVFKVRPDLRNHPDFAKLAEDLEAMMETDF